MDGSVAHHGEASKVPDKLKIERLNGLSREDFVGLLGGVFESSPWVAESVWHKRPFGSVDALHAAMYELVQGASIARQEALICAHPDLVGRAALSGTLTPESTREQAAAGLDRLTPSEIATFQELNAAYHDRFGFPFIICVRENKKEAILHAFAVRLTNSRKAEIEKALDEIARIARLRLAELIEV